ncbi:MAG: hypothetical protein QXU98_05095 [Candidatus Parvarchaeota archaeon]
MTNQEFAQMELERIEKERAEALEQKGYKPFYKIKEGTHVLEFSKEVEPRTNILFPGRSILRVKAQDGQEYDVSVSRAGPLYKDIMKNLAAGNFKLQIQRIGTGIKDSRYLVKPV